MWPQHECPVCRQLFDDIFELTSHVRTHGGPARSYSRGRKAPKPTGEVDVNTAHCIEVKNEQPEDTFTLKSNGNSEEQSDVFQIRVDYLTVHNIESVKQEPEEGCYDGAVYPEALRGDLCAEHLVKEELLLGPVLQPLDVDFIRQSDNEQSLTSIGNSPTVLYNESMEQGTGIVKKEPDERSPDLFGAVGSPRTHMNASTIQGSVTVKEEPEERCCNEIVSPEPAEVGLFVEQQIQDYSRQAQILCQPPDFAFIAQKMSMPTDTVLNTTHSRDVDREHSKDSLPLTFNKPPLKTYSRASKLSEKQPKLTEAVDSPVPAAHSKDLKQESVIVSVKEDPKGVEEHKIQTGLSEKIEEMPENGSGIGLKEETPDFVIDKEVKLEAARFELYEDHEIKDELVLGPETLHSPYVFYTLPGQVQLAQKKEPVKTNKCKAPIEKKIEQSSKEKITLMLTLQEPSTSSQEDLPWKAGIQEISSETSTLNGRTKFKCDHGRKSFNIKSHIKKHVHTHMVLKDKASKNFTCNSCSCKFDTKLLLLEHGKSQHGIKYFSCNTCNFTTKHASKLQVHLRTHSGEKPYKCSHCSSSFARSGDLQTHLREHTGEKPFKCSHCSSSFTESGNLQRHLRTHTGEKPFKCSHCSSSFAQSGVLLRHLRTHTGEKPFKCSHCSSSFAQNGNLQDHLRIHTGEKPYKCSHCSSSFTGSGNLQRHLRTHTGEKPFKCSHCSSSFTESGNLQRHLRTHTGEKPFKCSHCSSSFTQSCHLQTHLRTHTGQKSFKCSHCSSSFARSGGLQTHLRTHTGEKPFKCSHCSSSFARSGGLQTHLRTHTGEKPYECNICDYKATESGQLKSHLMSRHSGQKPFACDACGYRGATRSHIRQHMKRQHKSA